MMWEGPICEICGCEGDLSGGNHNSPKECIEALLKQQKALCQERDQRERERDYANTRIQSLERQLAAQSAAMEKADELLRGLDESQDICPVCHDRLCEGGRRITHRQLHHPGCKLAAWLKARSTRTEGGGDDANKD